DSAELANRLTAAGIESDVFHVNYVPGMDTATVLESARRTGRMVLLDDSKTVTKFGDALVAELKSRDIDLDVLSLGRRGCRAETYGVAEERFLSDCDTVSISRDAERQ